MKKIAYIDAQNVHKAIQELWWFLDWWLLFSYLKNKFEVSEVKIFFWYVQRHETLYTSLRKIWYTVVFKETLILPNGQIKWNVDIDIAIVATLDLLEWGLEKMYLLTGDGDYNSLVDLFKKREKLGRVLIPNRQQASKLLKKSAWPDIQALEDLRFFLEKRKIPGET